MAIMRVTCVRVTILTRVGEKPLGNVCRGNPTTGVEKKSNTPPYVSLFLARSQCQIQ